MVVLLPSGPFFSYFITVIVTVSFLIAKIFDRKISNASTKSDVYRKSTT